VEQKWRDALYVAAADLVSWEIVGTKPEKPQARKQMGNPKKAWNAEGTTGELPQ
jgi:hypothetical protein